MNSCVSKNRIAWLANLKPTDQPQNVRKTSLICTIGPVTQSVEKITELRKAGMNIARLNFSHGTHEYHTQTIANVRESERQYPGRPVGIALDTKGPEIRTGNTKDHKDIPFSAGHEMIFTMDPAEIDNGCLEKLYIDYPNLWNVVEPGRIIYMDDGIMGFRVLETHKGYVKVVALNRGALSDHKGINLPGSNVDLPALSAKDKADLTFGVEQGVDMVFASFIRTAQDVRDIRSHLGAKGKHIKIIVKIESTQGVANFDDILAETDGVMLARGDLGIEVPAEEVFMIQKQVIAKCNIAGKPVACATQMLDSMIQNPRPTRAEVSDVANAVIDGADLVMLSGESAKGKYPIEAVQMQSKIARLSETCISYGEFFNEIRASTKYPVSNTEATASSAVNAANLQDAKAIVCLTTSGNSARLLSKYRPSVPIIVVSRDYHIVRQAHLSRGCFPYLYKKPAPVYSDNEGDSKEQWQRDVDERIQFAIEHGIQDSLLKQGDEVICIQGSAAGEGNTNTMRIL